MVCFRPTGSCMGILQFLQVRRVADGPQHSVRARAPQNSRQFSKSWSYLYKVRPFLRISRKSAGELLLTHFVRPPRPCYPNLTFGTDSIWSRSLAASFTPALSSGRTSNSSTAYRTLVMHTHTIRHSTDQSPSLCRTRSLLQSTS